MPGLSPAPCAYLQIVSEEPPLREIPVTCHPSTVKVFRAGLVKDPGERASASELKEKSRDALRAGNLLHKHGILFIKVLLRFITMLCNPPNTFVIWA